GRALVGGGRRGGGHRRGGGLGGRRFGGSLRRGRRRRPRLIGVRRARSRIGDGRNRRGVGAVRAVRRGAGDRRQRDAADRGGDDGAFHVRSSRLRRIVVRSGPA